jgi:Spy/CpxP family protein refolding chaperone
MARKYGLLILVGFLGAALLACEAQAQPGGGGPGGGMRGMGGMGGGMGGGNMALTLLLNEKVQKELELVDDQITKIKAVQTESQTAMREVFSSIPQDASQEERMTKMRELMTKSQENTKKKLAEILLPKQLERLQQLQIQAEGAQALSNPDVVKALDITSDQQSKMQTIRQEYMTKMRESMGANQNQTREERTAAREKSNKELSAKLMEVLTPDQTAKLEKMKGPKSDIDFTTIRPAGGARGNRGGGGGGGGGAN